jgi:hypothetical protein
MNFRRIAHMILLLEFGKKVNLDIFNILYFFFVIKKLDHNCSAFVTIKKQFDEG